MPLDLFGKTKLPDKIPSGMEDVIDELKILGAKEECLKRVYDILSEKYEGRRYLTYLKISSVFRKDANGFWKKQGFMHCTNINYLARILLVKSGKFSEDDIKLRWTLIWGVSPHQYLQVNIGDKWIKIDIWARPYDIKYGDNAHGFH